MKQSEDGFRPEVTHYKLVFTDEKLAGLRVTVSSMPIRKRLAFDEHRWQPVTTFQEVTEKKTFLLQTLSEVLVTWNLLDPRTGKPVPPTVDGMLDQDPEVMDPIVNAWIEAIAPAPRPLPTPEKPDPLADIPTTPIRDSDRPE